MVNSKNTSATGLDFLSFSQLLRIAATLSFIIISFGSLVRAASAGLACPDWPLCFGELVPTFDYQIFLEWFHRLLAGCLAILLIFSAIKLSRNRLLRKSLGLQLFVCVFLLSVQIVLGGLTVLKLLDAKTVVHLINAILFFTVLVWMAVRSRQMGLQLTEGIKAGWPKDPTRTTKQSQSRIGFPASFSRLRKITLTLCCLVFLQLAVGGMVSTNYAGLACPDFPRCHGQWIPPLNFHLWIQMVHRLLGFCIVLFSIPVAFSGSRSMKSMEGGFPYNGGSSTRLTKASLKRIVFMRKTFCAIPFMVAIQIGIGILNIAYFLPTSVTVTHLANAVAIYALLLMMVVYLYEPIFRSDWEIMISSTQPHKTTFQKPYDGAHKQGDLSHGQAPGHLPHSSPHL